MDRGAHRNRTDRQGMACADRCVQTRDQLGADLEAARRDDVATLAIGIAQQGDMRAAVGVVFQALDAGDDAVLVATEVDDAVVLLVTAATVTHRDVAVVIAARIARLGFEQGCIARSEEHTSELQSLMRSSYAVFCLKNKKTKQCK